MSKYGKENPDKNLIYVCKYKHFLGSFCIIFVIIYRYIVYKLYNLCYCYFSLGTEDSKTLINGFL